MDVGVGVGVGAGEGLLGRLTVTVVPPPSGSVDTVGVCCLRTLATFCATSLRCRSCKVQPQFYTVAYDKAFTFCQCQGPYISGHLKFKAIQDFSNDMYF